MVTWRTRRLEELERNGILEYQEILETLERNGILEYQEILEGLGRNANLENQEVRRVGKKW